jgi:hypothetical protein
MLALGVAVAIIVVISVVVGLVARKFVAWALS